VAERAKEQVAEMKAVIASKSGKFLFACKNRLTLTPLADSALVILGTSKDRWVEWEFRIPESGGSAGLAP
jgi:hypothetical protein